MARFTEDDFAALQSELDRDEARALGEVRRAHGAQQNATTAAWLTAGDNLAEKAIAAIDTGDDVRAARLVQRIVDLPVIDDDVRSGLMAVSLLLYNEVVDPLSDGAQAQGLLELPLRLLPTLDAPAADELRHCLASFADYELPASVLRRVRDVVPLERRFDSPFAGVPEDALPEAITAVLRLVLQLRTAEE